MTNAYDEVLGEARERLAHVQGELAAVRDQLAASLATELQLREELAACKAEVAVTRTELAQAQKRDDERMKAASLRIAELEEQLQESKGLQQAAERERASVIAVLGRRAKRQLEQPVDA